VIEGELHFPTRAKGKQLYLAVLWRVESRFLVSGLKLLVFPSFLLPFFLLLGAGPIVTWKTYTGSYEVILDVLVLKKKGS